MNVGFNTSFSDINTGLFGNDTNTTSNENSTISGGQGDVSKLGPIIDEMLKSIDPAGMEKLFQAIFKSGFEKQMPSLLNNANTTGIRPQDSTTHELLTNDLIARLTGEAAKALGTQQVNAANAATNYAAALKSPVVKKSTVTTEAKSSGILDSLGLSF